MTESDDLIRQLNAQARPPAFGVQHAHSGAKPDMARVAEAMRVAGQRIKMDNLGRGSVSVTPASRDFGPCGHFPMCTATAQAVYLTGPRCPTHTPAALAGRPETHPDPARTLEAARQAARVRTR